MDVRLKIDKETMKIKGLMAWHPVNGEWVHIAQMFDDDDKINYFTNGEEIIDLPLISENIQEIINKSKDYEAPIDSYSNQKKEE